MDIKETARNIQKRHVANGPGSWASCSCCQQAYRGGSESQPMWPCDARRLADEVLNNG